VDVLVLNRYNKGLFTLATTVAANNGCVSFRPRELGRHDRIEDWLSLLRHSQHAVVSSRHGVMKALAQHMNIKTKRGWPAKKSSLNEAVFINLALSLSEIMRPNAVVVLHRDTVGDTLFYNAQQQPMIVETPAGHGTESRAARMQGALLALSLLRNHSCYASLNTDSWQGLCEDTVTVGLLGTDQRPWYYPDREAIELAIHGTIRKENSG